jgi:hypothetical protein
MHLLLPAIFGLVFIKAQGAVHLSLLLSVSRGAESFTNKESCHIHNRRAWTQHTGHEPLLMSASAVMSRSIVREEEKKKHAEKKKLS